MILLFRRISTRRDQSTVIPTRSLYPQRNNEAANEILTSRWYSHLLILQGGCCSGEGHVLQVVVREESDFENILSDKLI